MAVNRFSLYLADGTSPVNIPQPNYGDWGTIYREPFPDGRVRESLYKKVTWRFVEMEAVDFQKFAQYRLSGRQTFETWKEPTGAVAGAFVVCTGIMKKASGRKNQHGVYKSVTVEWLMVLQS